MKYVSLAPRNEKKPEYEEYYKALDFAIRDKTIMNIAVTGPYGAGKSSVIDSYLENRKNLKAIKVSLAKFANIPNTNSDSDLEEEVLKYLFYAIDGRRIGGSLYSQIKERPSILDAIRMVYLISFVIITVAVFKWATFYIFEQNLIVTGRLQEITRMLHQSLSDFCVQSSIGKAVTVLGAFSVIALVCITVREIMKIIEDVLKRIDCIRIDILNANIHKKDNNIIDQNIHEIINMIINIDENVFVFEDLDRCKNHNVFVKLRNICILVNNNEIIKNKFKKIRNCIFTSRKNGSKEELKNNSCIKFIYAIKDDFTYDDKNNKKDIIKENIVAETRTKFFDFIIPIIPIVTQNNIPDDLSNVIKENKINAIDNKFIDEISIYIDNKRILNNIINEFNVYRGSLAKANESFDDRQLLTLIIFKNIDPKGFDDIQERDVLREVFSKINKKKAELSRKYRDELSLLEKKVYPHQTSEDVSRIQQLEERLNILETSDSYSSELQELYTVLDDYALNDFVKMAIRNQYIDTNNYNYINYFYEGQLSLKDRQIIKVLRSGNGQAITDELIQVKNVYERLDDNEYYKRSVYNMSLMKYAIFERYDDRKTKILVKTVLENYGVESIIRFSKYVDENEMHERSDEIVKKLLKLAMLEHETVFDNVNSDVNIDEDNQFYLANKIALLLSDKDIQKINKNNELTEIVSKNIRKISRFDNDSQDKYLREFDIDCDLIPNNYNEYDSYDRIFIEKIVNEKIRKSVPIGYYTLLKVYFLHTVDDGGKNDIFEHSNYDYILKYAKEELIENINENLDLYVEKCLLKTSVDRLTADLVFLLYRLQTIENVKNIILRLQNLNKISDFDYNFSDEDEDSPDYTQRKKLIYEYALENKYLNLDLNSLYKCFILNGWTTKLTDYIASKIDFLINNCNIYEEENIDKFYSSMLVNCSGVKNVDQLLNNKRINISANDFSLLSDNLKQRLVKNNNLEFHVQLLQLIRSFSGESLIMYVSNNINSFLKNDVSFQMTSEEIEKLIIKLKDTKRCSEEEITMLINKQLISMPNIPNEGATENHIIYSDKPFASNIEKNIVSRFTKNKKIEYIISKSSTISKDSLLTILRQGEDVFAEFKVPNFDKAYFIKKGSKNTAKIKSLVDILSKKSLVSRTDGDDGIHFQKLYL